MLGKVCYQPPLYSSPRVLSSGTQDTPMDEEDAVSSREINRRQKETGSNGILQIKEDAKLTALKTESLLFMILPTSTRQPLRLPKLQGKP